MHTFVTMREAEGLKDLSAEARALDQGAINAIAFHDPKRLKEESIRHQRRVRRLADRNNGSARQKALEDGDQIIERVKVLGGPK